MSLPTRATSAAGPSAPRASAGRNDFAAAIAVASGRLAIAALFPGFGLLLLDLVEQLLLGLFLVFVNGRREAASRQGCQQLLNLLKRFVGGRVRTHLAGPGLEAAKLIRTCDCRTSPLRRR